MTSVLKRYSQIEPRIKFFTLLQDCQAWIIPYSQAQPVMDISSFIALAPSDHINHFPYSNSYPNSYPNSGYPAGAILQDLGRQITVYDPAVTGSPHVGLFRQVMYLTGAPENEGIGTNAKSAYICVWGEDSTYSYFTPALVARTG